MVCLNKEKYKDELDTYNSILGSEAAAYYAIAMNNGYTLDKDPQGNPSKLYQDILNACGGNVRDAILEKSYYYTQHYLKTDDWIERGSEPVFFGLNGLHNSNTTAQNVLQNDAFNEINSTLIAAGAKNEEYAMFTAIEKSRQAYLDFRDGEFHNTRRQENIKKYNSRSLWKKFLGFFFSRYNKDLLQTPSSEERQQNRKEALDEFNATVEYLILDQLKTELRANTNSQFAAQLAKYIDDCQLSNNKYGLQTIMSYFDIARTNTPITHTSNTASHAVSIIRDLNIKLYTDGIALFKTEDSLIRALNTKDINKYNQQQQNYINSFNIEFKNQFISPIQNISSQNIEEASLMWTQRGTEEVSASKKVYDAIRQGFESRLISLQKRKGASVNVQYLVKSKIEKLKRHNLNSNKENFDLYCDFIASAIDELQQIRLGFGNILVNRTLGPVDLPNGQDLIYNQTDVIGFYSNIINEHLNKLTEEDSGLTDVQLKQIKDLINNDVNPILTDAISKYNSVLDLYCQEQVDSFVDENFTLGDVQHHHKHVLMAQLRNQIKSGSIGIGETWFGDATQSQSMVVKMIANMLNNDEREVVRQTTHVGHNLLDLYSKAESYVSKLGIDPMNYMKTFCELDENGLPTGYFVRGSKQKDGRVVGINYGKFEKARKKKETELRKKYGLLADDHGNTIWNFDIKGEEDTFNKYMDDLDDWLEKHCDRRFTAEYYKKRRRILTRDAREAINEIQSQIQLLLKKCTDPENGYIYTSNLSPEEYRKLKDLRLQKEQLSNLYEPILDENGQMVECKKKTGKRLEIAESIIQWNKFIQNNVQYKPDYTKYNKARNKLTTPAEKAAFDYDNKQLRLSQEFYARLANCSTTTQTEYYHKLSSSKSRVTDIYRKKKGYYYNANGELETYIDIDRLDDNAWAALREIETEMAANRTPPVKGVKPAEKFDDVAKVKQVMHPSGIPWIEYLYNKASYEVQAGINPHAIDEYYNKYFYIKPNGSYGELSIFSYIVPVEDRYVEEELINGYSELDDHSTFVNDNFSNDEDEAYQPKESIYKNDTYDKIQKDAKAKAFYDEMLRVMDEAVRMMPETIATSKYRMPQITANSSDILSRNLAKGNISGAIGSISQHFTVNENDTDIYREDLAKRPDGTIVENVPIRFVSSLEDPTQISCDIVKTVIQFYAMAKNYQLKSITVPKCEALISQMKGGMVVGNQKESEQSKRAELELQMYGYGREERGFGNPAEKMTKSNKFWTKFVNNFRSTANVALLAGNVFSASKGFISAYYQTGVEAFVGRYYDKGDRLWTTGQLLMEIPNAIRSITQGNTKSKIQAAMQYNGLGQEYERSFGKHDKTGIRRLLSHFKMGLFTAGDYSTNAIIMMSVYHATRLIKNPRTGVYEFMTEEECIDQFNKVGKSEKEAISYFDKHSDNHLYNMYDLTKNGDFVLKQKVTVKIDGKEVEIDPRVYVTPKVENRIAGTVERRASVINGVVAKHGKNMLYNRTLSKLLVTMRGYLFSQGWDRFKGGDDFNTKLYDDGSFREFNNNSNKLYRGQYDLETGHCEIGIWRSVYRTIPFIGGDCANFWHDVMLALPLINKMLKDQNRKFSKTDMQNIVHFCLDVAGIATFGLMCAWIFIPAVKRYPDEWWAQFGALVSAGCMIETSTPINPTTATDLFQTVTTTYSYLKDVQTMSTSIGDVFGLSGHDPHEYIRSGGYKSKPRWFKGVMKSLLKPTGLTGYYETFTPSIAGLDDPTSKFAKRSNKILNRIDRRGLQFSDFYGDNSIWNALTTPLGVQSKYDWYNQNASPATWLPKRKNPKTKKQKQEMNKPFFSEMI